MKTMSTERERKTEQCQRNRRRLDWWRRQQTNYVVEFLDGADISPEKLPRSIFHQRQAD